jgi:transposase
MNEKKQTRRYDKEFKENAVKLYLNGERTYDQLSEDLGVPCSTLASWVASYQCDGQEAFPGKGNLKTADKEQAKLVKELAIVKEERDILKKALGIFSSARK